MEVSTPPQAPPPPAVSGLLVDGLKIPVTLLLCVGAAALTAAMHGGVDVERLLLDRHGFFVHPLAPWTSALLHVNLIHLVFNVFWTWKFGAWIERQIGSLRTLMFAAGLAVGAAAAEYAASGGGIGLSGVGYGWFAFLWVRRRVDSSAKEVLGSNAVPLFVVWFFLCIALTWFDVMPIGNYAHAAGAALGAGVAWAWNASGPRRTRRGTWTATALGACVVAAELGPSHSPANWAFVGRLEATYQRQDLAAMSHMTEQALARDPHDGIALWYRAWVLAWSDQPRAARIALDQADAFGTRTAPPSETWWAFVDGRLAQLRAQESWKTLEVVAEEARSIDPRSPAILCYLGYAKLKTGRSTEACEHFERAYELAPSDATARAFYAGAKYERARAACDDGSFAVANQHIRDGLKVAPDHPSLLEIQRTLAQRQSRSR